jgi:MoaA/NifB/PqqE/SkfB family radical SAM enzyme
MHYTILYRGPLSSCNYGCVYCPFAKRRQDRLELEQDRAALRRFVCWVRDQRECGHRFSVLFTPWGEALTRTWYREALVCLTNLPQVHKAAVQTNLSCQLDWIGRCDLSKLGLWCSYHPTQTTRARFLDRCRSLSAAGARYSVGIVGLKEHLAEADALRRELPPGVYLWVNALKRMDDYYTSAEIDAFAAIDPLFSLNNTRHPSLGRACRAGHRVFSVDGAGTMRRCHFIPAAIGNIYEPGWEQSLRPSPCTNAHCGCHIGYVHMPALSLDEVFGQGLLERIPSTFHWKAQAPSTPPPASAPGRRLVRMSLRQVSAGPSSTAATPPADPGVR